MALVVGLMNAGCSTAPDQTTWGSDQVTLRIAGSGAQVQILGGEGCYGSFGAIDHPIPTGTFRLSGTFTQLMGVFPGSVQYPAEFTGNVTGTTMMLSISMPTLPLTLGPFQLTAGVTKSWSACLFP